LQNKPFCSGMYYYVRFADPAANPDREPTIFEWAGALPALTRMTRLFYEQYVPADPLLAPCRRHVPDHPQRVAKWLERCSAGLGATAGVWRLPRMLFQHLGRELTERNGPLAGAADGCGRDAGLPNDPEFRSAFGSYIEWDRG